MEIKYPWRYCSLGGVTRVKLSTGEDIAHLGELDQKLWTVLSCPVDGLIFDKKTLEILDSDKDGRIRVGEVVAAAQWLTSVIKDKDLILNGSDSLPLDSINTENPTGERLARSARQRSLSVLIFAAFFRSLEVIVPFSFKAVHTAPAKVPTFSFILILSKV